METVFKANKVKVVVTESDQFDLSKESAFPILDKETHSEKPNLKLVTSSSLPSPKKPDKRSVWDQIKGGIKAAWSILYPTALILWLGGALADKTIKIFSPSQEPTISNPLPKWLISKAEENSTANFQFETSHKAWKGLVTFRVLLGEYSPSIAKWFDNRYREGKVTFVGEDTRFGDSRYSDYRKWNENLTLFPSFFTLSDAKKIIALEHEYAHSNETLPGYISSSVTPQVVIGAGLRTFGVKKEITDLGHDWAYYGNFSEVAAIEAENRAAIRLGQTDLVLDDYKFNKVIPGQTVLGIFAASSYILSFLKRRKMQH